MNARPTRLLCVTAFFLLAGNSGATDRLQFYDSRPGQAIKASDLQKHEIGYDRDNEIAHVYWRGHVTGKDVNLNVYGREVFLRVGSKVVRLRTDSAVGFTSEQVASELDPFTADIYVVSAKNADQSLICVESLGPDVHVRPFPYWQVYLIASPLTNPRLYRLSGINSSCRGIERTNKGKLVVPQWTVDREAVPTVAIDYYEIGTQRLRKAERRVTGAIASGDAQDYIIDAPEL